MYINFEILEKEGFTETMLLTLIKVNQRVSLTSEEMDIAEELLEGEYLKEIKTGKYLEDRLRIDKKGKGLMAKVSLKEDIDAVALCDELVDLYESNGMETGNKRKCLENLTWLLQETELTHDDVREGLDYWISNGWGTWLCNVFWDSKGTNPYHKKRLANSPLYETIRRNNSRQW